MNGGGGGRGLIHGSEVLGEDAEAGLKKGQAIREGTSGGIASRWRGGQD